MHRLIYSRRPDVQAVVHAHPPVATAFAVAGCCLNTRSMPESILTLGEVPFIQYATPGTEEIPQALEPYLAGHDAFLLAHHGALAVGTGLQIAFDLMLTLEHTARILLAARILGGARVLSDEDLRRLVASRPSAVPAEPPAPAHAGGTAPSGSEDLARVVAEAVLRHLKQGGATGS
jgi:L-fuculose-phosphate aldolase